MSRSTALTEERCQALVAYLQGSKRGSPEYPPDFSNNDKRALRQQAASFEVDQGLLYHKATDSQCGTVRRQRVLVTTEEKNRIMRACHDGVDGSHFGRDKTLSKVSNKKDSVHKDVIKSYCDFYRCHSHTIGSQWQRM